MTCEECERLGARWIAEQTEHNITFEALQRMDAANEALNDALREARAQAARAEAKSCDALFDCAIEERDDARAQAAKAQAVVELGRLLAIELHSLALDLARPAWGNTNTAVIKMRRDDFMAALEALADV